MAKNFRTDVLEGGLTVDPTVGAGVAAEIGSFLARRGTTQWWMKTGAAATAWTLASTGGGAVMFWGNDDIGAAADVRYLTPGHAATAIGSDIRQTPMPCAGVLRNLFVRHNAAAGDGDPVVYTVQVNGIDTALTCSVVSNAITQSSDTVNTVAIAQGDRVTIKLSKALSITNGAIQVCASLELI